MALWDPAHGLFWKECNDLVDGEEVVGDLIVQRKGNAYVRSVRQVDFERKMGDTTHFAANKQNLLVISAGQGALSDYGMHYINAALDPKRFISLPEAGHGFTEGDALQDLYKATISWFEQQI